jgi:cellobiose transport system substrate-binding protein
VRTTRKWLTLSAGLLGVALVATGCGSSAATDASSSAADDTTPVTLSVATFNEFGYDNLYAEYMKLHPNVTIVPKKAATSQEARDNMNTRLAAGSGLSDIEAIEVDWLPELMQSADKFADLRSDETNGRWLDWKAAQATTPDGKLIGYGTDIGPEAICYRSDLFAAAGLPTDRAEVAKLLGSTWDDYFAAGKKFAAKSKVPWMDSAGATYNAMVNQLEYAYENKDGSPIPLDQNTQVKALYDQVLKAGGTDGLSAHLGEWSEDWTAGFQKNAFATMACPGWMLGVIQGNSAGVKGWDIADTFPGGGGNWGGSFLTVPEQGQHKAEAIKLAAWLTAPEQQIKAFKAKGTFPSQVDALKSPDLLGQTNAFFNNAPTGQILANRAAAVKVRAFKGVNYFAIHQIVGDAIARVDVDKTDDAASSWAKAVAAYNALGLG